MQQGLSISTSRGFPAWLADMKVSIAFTTYESGRAFFIGLDTEGRPAAVGRKFPRCMGLAVSSDGRSVLMATERQIYRFDNIGQRTDRSGTHDAVYAPHQAWITGDVDAHEIGFSDNELPVFACTAYNCLATVSPGYSFKPLWRPSFISRLVPEDRCHLNGIAFEAGRPKFVTCLSRTDTVDGWRDHRKNGGVLIDVPSGEIVTFGLSMPHSPRLHNGRLWLLNSGSGEFGWVDLDEGRFHPMAFCPGYVRGLAFVGDHAVVGLSLARKDRSFDGLALEAALRDRGVSPRCGLMVIDLSTGAITDWLRIEGMVGEIFDVLALRGVRSPSILEPGGVEGRGVIAIDQP